MSTKPWEIYVEQLFPSGYGHPLWKPEPNAESGREVFIGDVGWLVEGEFRALFNSMKDADDPINQAKSVPRDFAVFPSTNLSIGRSDRINASIVFSRSITVDNAQAGATTDAPGGAPGWRFQTKSDAGAMVMLRPPAVADDIESRRHIVSYMRDNFDSWLEFANASDSSWGGLALRPEDILFVCGTLKTTQWALAAFQGSAFRNKDGVVSGQLDTTGSGDVQFSVQIDGQPLPASHQRAGPVGRPSGAPDQCLFIRYYKMKRRLLGREPMQAAAGPHQLPPGADNSGTDAMALGRAPRASPSTDNECNDTYYDPVNHLLDYILRTSEADIAIASDLDLVALFREGTFPADIPAALAELSPAVEVDEHGVGTISVEHGSVEMERLSDEKAYTYRGHEDMSLDLPATCPLESPEAPSCLQSTLRDFAAPAPRQSTVYSPASQGEPNPQRSKDSVNWTSARPGEDMVSLSGEKYCTAVPDSMTTSIRDMRDSTVGPEEAPMRDGDPTVAPRALSCGEWYLTSASASGYLVGPLLVSVDA